MLVWGFGRGCRWIRFVAGVLTGSDAYIDALPLWLFWVLSGVFSIWYRDRIGMSSDFLYWFLFILYLIMITKERSIYVLVLRIPWSEVVAYRVEHLQCCNKFVSLETFSLY